MKTDRSKYRTVIDRVLYSIRSGDLQPGQPFYSRREICEKFDLSLVPASKVQQELRESGFLSRIPGRGFVIASGDPSLPPLKRIRIFGSRRCVGSSTEFGRRMEAGIREEAEKHGIEVVLEFVDVLNNDRYAIHNRTLPPDEGLIPNGGVRIFPEIASVLARPQSRIVLYNNVAWEHAAVLVDNAHGIRELLKFHREQGGRKLLYAGCISASHRQINESERNSFFHLFAGEMGLETAEDLSGNYRSVLETAKKFEPDGILFAGDDAALHFRNVYGKELRKKTVITGFDDIVLSGEPGREHLTTYRIDCEEMGRRAVRLLMSGTAGKGRMIYDRVPGKIVVRS